jgi:hypothetical protein
MLFTCLNAFDLENISGQTHLGFKTSHCLVISSEARNLAFIGCKKKDFSAQERLEMTNTGKNYSPTTKYRSKSQMRLPWKIYAFTFIPISVLIILSLEGTFLRSIGSHPRGVR